jgi:hypothetical protein
MMAGLDIEQLSVVPDIFMASCKKDPPARWKREVWQQSRTALRQVLDMDRLEEIIKP